MRVFCCDEICTVELRQKMIPPLGDGRFHCLLTRKQCFIILFYFGFPLFIFIIFRFVIFIFSFGLTMWYEHAASGFPRFKCFPLCFSHSHTSLIINTFLFSIYFNIYYIFFFSKNIFFWKKSKGPKNNKLYWNRLWEYQWKKKSEN